MIDLQSSMLPPFSYERDLSPYEADQQSLCTSILDAINNEIDIIVNLLSEGNNLLEYMDDEINIKDITTIVNNLNNQLFRNAIRMNALKHKMRKSI